MDVETCLETARELLNMSVRMRLTKQVMTIELDGEEYRKERLRRGLTIKEAAKRAGISAGFLCDIEKNYRGCSNFVVERLLAALEGPRK